MKELKVFYLETCLYCQNARRALKELQDEDPAYAQVKTEWIEESREPEVAEAYDYYRVPSVFCCDRKLYECDPGDGFTEIKRNLKAALDACIGCKR